ncbi:MAG TPA: putative ABC transporter permease [Candidatus Excrementavichristensenella intestinipullorum]|nr:putative ABC transporter permease [Candidatus Excrementavichristensenella intestinipullorum]
MALEQWFLWFMAYSFIGWAYESILCSIVGKRLVNRGFLNGPVCPIYGTGAVAVVWALGSFRDQVAVLFLLSAFLTTTLEYLTSWVMEKLFHARWWDYSGRLLNIHGRVCLLGFTAFGTMAVLVVRYVQPWLAGLTGRLSATAVHVLCVLLAAALAADIAMTLTTVLGLDKLLRRFREALSAEMVDFAWPKGLHRFQIKRLSLAFPKLRSTRYPVQWQKMREHLNAKREQFNAKREQLTNKLEEMIK